jgi:hypothetical protein
VPIPHAYKKFVGGGSGVIYVNPGPTLNPAPIDNPIYYPFDRVFIGF